MHEHGTNPTAVSTGCVRAPVPASKSPSSNDPPSYSVCVPYPPTFNSNDPDGHSSLLVNPPEVCPPSEISSRGIQTLLDVPSTSENPPGVHEPRVTPNNGQPAQKPSCTATQGNPPPYGHEKKTILLCRIGGNSRRNRSVGLRTAIVFGITILTIIFATKTRRIHYNDIPDVYDEKKINFDNKYRIRIFGFGNGTVMVDFAMLRRIEDNPLVEIGGLEFREARKAYLGNVDVDRSPGDKVNKTKIEEHALKDLNGEYRETDININLDDHTDYISKRSGKQEDDDDSTAPNFELKYPDFPDVSSARPSKFGDQKNDDASRNANINPIANRFANILGIPRKGKTNENVVQKPASNDDSEATLTII